MDKLVPCAIRSHTLPLWCWFGAEPAFAHHGSTLVASDFGQWPKRLPQFAASLFALREEFSRERHAYAIHLALPGAVVGSQTQKFPNDIAPTSYSTIISYSITRQLLDVTATRLFSTISRSVAAAVFDLRSTSSQAVYHNRTKPEQWRVLCGVGGR